MAKKEVKTNAIRILERNKIPYEAVTYECDEFTDGVTIARKNGQDPKNVFKTLATIGKSGQYYIFVLPVAEELDFKKCAKAVGEKNVEMIHVKEITKVTGYVRGTTTALGMKKNYPVTLHESAKDVDVMYVSGGRLGLQLKLTPENYIKATKCQVADIIK